MDNDGDWRSPEEWPEDYAPLPGWVRHPDGSWGSGSPPKLSELEVILADEDVLDLEGEPAEPVVESKPRRSRQAAADIRSMLLLAGVVAAVMLLLVAALVLISRAGASDDERSSTDTPGVIFPAETESDVLARRSALAVDAPALARLELVELVSAGPVPDDVAPFDEVDWSVPDDGCLSNDEQVLLRRSNIPVGFADTIECVPATGGWFDRYQARQIRRTIDAEVAPIVSASNTYLSGGWNWTPATRLAFLTDSDHPANLQVIAAGSGHNPRGLAPDEWKPAEDRTWCAYAVDWVATKSRWKLTVTESERTALDGMLDSCADPTTDGADPNTMLLSPLMAPDIELLSD